MAQIKLEILLDSKEQKDVNAFANLMNAFSGTPAVHVLNSGSFPTEALKRTLEAQSPSTQDATADDEIKGVQSTTTEIRDYSEEEMMDMPNANLKDYVAGLGIDWGKAEGKNTNRKLANLVLEFRNGVTAEAAKDEAPAETAEDLTKEDDLTGEAITYNDLKVSLGKKVDEHREAIVAKLEEFGATKMPNLAEEHWTEMYNFMEAL